jgi:hypothetical protein
MFMLGRPVLRVSGFGGRALSSCAAAAMLAACGAPIAALQGLPARPGSAVPDLRISTWHGTLTQPVFGTYSFRIHVRSSSGGQISGTSRIQYGGSEWAIMSFTGTASNGTVNYTETGILKQHGGNWCIKSATLQFHQEHVVLKGPWTASGCTGGEIRVRREKDTLDVFPVPRSGP